MLGHLIGGRKPNCVLLGGFLIHLVMGTVYTWGSMTIYLTSYLRVYDESVTYNNSIVIYACTIAGQAALMFLGGHLELRVGPRVAASLGSIFLVGAPLISSRVTSYPLMIFTYGVLFGFGGGLTYTVPLVCGYRWEPNRKGLVSGIVLSGFGLSALIFNQIQSSLVNPDNLKPEVEYRGKRYFGPGPVTDAVPGMLVKLGLIYGVLCVCGIALIQDPTYKKIDDKRGEGGRRGNAYMVGSTSASSSPLRRRLCDDDTTMPESPEEGNGGIGVGVGVGGELATVAAATATVGAAAAHHHQQLQQQQQQQQQGGGEYDGLVLRPDGNHYGGGGGNGTAKVSEEQHGGAGGGGEGADDDADTDVTPFELVRLPQAWHVSLSFTMGAISGLVALAIYKSVGISTFVDDRFFSSVVGSFSSLSNAGGRVFWGWASDRLGGYRALITLCLCQAFFLFTWGLTVIEPFQNKWLYALWVTGITFSHGGDFAIYPALIATMFGKTNAAANFGLIFLGYGSASLVGLTVLPRLSAKLSPLNYILGMIALASAASVYCLQKCYVHHHFTLRGEKRRAQRQQRLLEQSERVALLGTGNGNWGTHSALK